MLKAHGVVHCYPCRQANFSKLFLDHSQLQLIKHNYPLCPHKVPIYNAEKFQVSTPNAVMIMLLNFKYVSETLRKHYGNIKHQFKLETCFHYRIVSMQLYKACYTCRAYNFVFPLPVRIHFHRNACGNPEALHMLRGWSN